MKVLLSHPTGNEFVRAVANGFAEAGILEEFHTTIAAFSGNFFELIGSYRSFSEFHRRRFHPNLKSITKLQPWKELGRHIANRLKIHSLTKHETGIFCVDSIYKSIDLRVARRIEQQRNQKINIVYAYEDGALQSFLKAKEFGLDCLYDLPIGYWRSARLLLDKEMALWPEWASTLTGFQDSPTKLARKDAELRLADRIFVASSFTANTLKNFPGQIAPIEVIPYGFPDTCAKREYQASNFRRLKLLFVGSLSQRKGIANLFAAIKAFESYVQLTVVGRKVNNNCPALENALAKHRWIPSLPHHEILKLMHSHDVLVFPSLFEGFGLVISEAMSQGTPVITTERTAGPDIIEHNRNGWLVEAGSTDELRAMIERLLDKPTLIVEAGREALLSAVARPWEVYGQELVQAIFRHEQDK